MFDASGFAVCRDLMLQTFDRAAKPGKELKPGYLRYRPSGLLLWNLTRRLKMAKTNTRYSFWAQKAQKPENVSPQSLRVSCQHSEAMSLGTYHPSKAFQM